MKHFIFFLLFITLIYSCNTTPPSEKPSAADSARLQNALRMAQLEEAKKKELEAKKMDSLYSEKFLEIVKDFNAQNDSVTLVENYLIFRGDTLHFPEELDKGTKYSFFAKNGKENYNLEIVRNKLTSFDFNLSCIRRGTERFRYTGVAELNSNFFLRSQDEGNNYADILYMFDYYCYTDSTGYLNIKIGFDDNNKIVAAFVAYPKDTAKNIIFNRRPMLQL